MSDKYLLVIGSIAIAFLLFVSSGLVKEDSSDHQALSEELQENRNMKPESLSTSNKEREEFNFQLPSTDCVVHMVKDGDPNSQAIILLHGMAFSSQVWKRIGTYSELSNSGYFVVGVDLPGKGQTKCSDKSFENKYEDFLAHLISALQLKTKPLIVAPSWSGRFVEGYLLEKFNADNPEISGIVWVAPALSAKDRLKQLFPRLSIPFLIVYGEKDGMGKRSESLLTKNPNHLVKVIPKGSHPCYLDDPDLFHNSVLAWISQSL
mmetsp:Transcript_3869/g.5200  ORF Transcript_3869/g.5200 Transcript_3869/m.5200 type:complete len:263 (+) Transcript_3869:2103-2891(+)